MSKLFTVHALVIGGFLAVIAMVNMISFKVAHGQPQPQETATVSSACTHLTTNASPTCLSRR